MSCPRAARRWSPAEGWPPPGRGEDGSLAARGRSIHIGRLGVRSPVQPIHVAGSALTPPSDPAVLGWWPTARALATRGEAFS